MRFILQNTILFLKFLVIIAQCICPTINENVNPSDIYINSSYSQEWWYFLHNVLDDTSPIVSIENTWIREGLHCNMTSLYLYQESILWKNGTFSHSFKYIKKNDNQKSHIWEIDNRYLYYYKRKNSKYNINIMSKSANISMEGYGYPQGKLKNGFVRTGKNSCDTSYTLSFLNLDSSINNFKAISYGEHVYTTQKKGSSPYIGWNCHYSHNLYTKLNFKAYFLCQSKFIDKSKKDPYQRALILLNNNSTIWTNNFIVTELQNWTNKKTNITYPISWKINLIKNSSHYLIANNPEQEVVSINNFNFWDGSAMLFDSEIGFIGVGFNEILITDK